MSDVNRFIKLVHQTSEEERTIAYKQASDILNILKKEGINEYDTEELLHFCIFRTCLIDIKITKLLKIIWEAAK